MSRVAPLSGYLHDLRRTFAQAARQARACGHPVLAAASFPLEGVDPFRVFAAWDDGATPCLYWESHAPASRFFAWGCALELSAHGEQRFAQLQASWRTLLDSAVTDGPVAPRACGGFRFDTRGERHPHWKDFTDASLMLANLTVLREADGGQVLCQHLVDAEDDPLALATYYCTLLLRLNRAPAPDAGAPALLSPRPSDPGVWQARAAGAVEAIRAGRFGKVVLARDQRYQATALPAAWQLLDGLRQQSGSAHLFACRRGSACFLGATPERLVRVNDGELQTHALAGTTARDDDPHRDAALAGALLASPKERQEHGLVVDAIRQALHPLCQRLDIAEGPVLHRLSRVQHLCTPIRGRLSQGVDLFDLVEALHPTPAVGGQPRDAALDYIRHHEALDRGWYAGPLGWVDAGGDGDFLVALRSALLTTDEARLFAGCGLVADSDPAREYRETCLKLAAMQAALHIGEPLPEARSLREARTL